MTGRGWTTAAGVTVAALLAASGCGGTDPDGAAREAADAGPERDAGSLEVAAAATATVRHAWRWELAKEATSPLRAPREAPSERLAGFRVTVNAAPETCEGCPGTAGAVVEGTVAIRNLARTGATIVRVAQRPLETEVDCGVPFPVALPAGETLACAFRMVGELPPEELAVEVATDGPVRGGTLVVPVEEAHVAVNPCVTVLDRLEGREPVTLGTVCAADLAGGARVFDYETPIAWPACGAFEVTNTAWAVGDGARTVAEASVTTRVEVACPGDGPVSPGGRRGASGA